MSDDSELLDEHGDVPPIILELDPINDIPAEEIALLGELMAWTAYIECQSASNRDPGSASKKNPLAALSCGR